MGIQNKANQKMIEGMMTDCDKQNRKIDRLQNELQEALNRLSKSSFINCT